MRYDGTVKKYKMPACSDYTRGQACNTTACHFKHFHNTKARKVSFERMKAEQERKKQDFKVATCSAVTGGLSGAGSGVSSAGGGAGMDGSMGNMGGFHRGGSRG